MRAELGPRLQPLRRLLASLYPGERDLFRVLSDCGIDRCELPSGDAALTLWYEALKLVVKHTLLARLIEVACEDYPIHQQDLKRLFGEIAPHLPGSRSPERIAHLASEGTAETSEVLDWPSTLPSGATLERPERQTIEQHLAGREFAVIVVLGEAGAGKSALLAVIGKALQLAGEQVLAVRLDRLGRDVTTPEGLQRYIGLSEPFVDVVEAMASQGPVTVIIDQLDALCDLMTERAGRLSLILESVEQLATIKNVHILLASRPFEYQHDVRLRRVHATEVHLGLPCWSDVEPHVMAAGVDPVLLSNELKDELCRPQTLWTFLDLIRKGHDWRLLPTYHAMRDILWQSQASATSEASRRKDALYRLARWMAEEEVLTRPRVQMEEWRLELGTLESAGWLKFVGSTRMGVTFRHQSLFDYVYARAMVEEGGSLLGAVLRHQGLFIRRRVWSVLSYLREASYEQYAREFARLWRAPQLRRHLKGLLIDFLGQIPAPGRQEICWILEALGDSSWRLHALIAVGRGTGWFVHLQERELPRAMTDTSTAGFCCPLLIGVSKEQVDLVLDLMERQWIHKQDELGRCAYVLEQLPFWNSRAESMASTVVQRLTFESHHLIEGLVSSCLEKSSHAAARIFGAALEAETTRRLDALALQPEPRRPSEDADIAEQSRWWSAMDRWRDTIRDIFEGAVYWTQLGGLVEADPGAFLEAVWPVMTRALQVIGHPSSKLPCFLSELRWREDHRGDEYLLIEHVRIAVEQLAKRSPDEYVAFLRQKGGSDLMSVQILLMEGLTSVAVSRPAAAVAFFREDRRRMLVGSELSRFGMTLQFLARVSVELDAVTQQALADIIATWRPLDTTPANWNAGRRYRHSQFVRQHRLKLLLCLDPARLNASTRARIEEEQRAFTGIKRPSCSNAMLSTDSRLSASVVESGMQASHMEKASDAEILKFFTDLPDPTEWHHPRRWMKGGSIEASREIAALAEKNPVRGLRLAGYFSPETHQRPVGMIVEAAAKAGHDADSLFDFILSCETQGFSDPEYRVHVAWGLEKIATRQGQGGLPPAICTIIKSWLTDNPCEVDRHIPERFQQDHPKRIIYRDHGFTTLPQGNYTFLQTLHAGLASRSPPAWNEWFAVLEEHLQRQEDPHVWQALALHGLRCLSWVEREAATRFMEKLVARFPHTLDVPASLVVVDHSQAWLPEALSRDWIESLRIQGDSWHAQVYGELLVLRCYRRPGEVWARTLIESAMTAPAPYDEVTCATRRGIAFMSAMLWREGIELPEAKSWVCRLASWEDPAVSLSLWDIFPYDDPPPFDEQIEFILSAVATHPFHLRNGQLDSFFHALHAYVVCAPDLVTRIAIALIEAFGQTLGDIRTAAMRYAGPLLDLALTLQDIPEQLDRGLDLFERLLALQLGEVEQVLNERESQPGTQVARRPRPISPRRRRRGEVHPAD